MMYKDHEKRARRFSERRYKRALETQGSTSRRYFRQSSKWLMIAEKYRMKRETRSEDCKTGSHIACKWWRAVVIGIDEPLRDCLCDCHSSPEHFLVKEDRA